MAYRHLEEMTPSKEAGGGEIECSIQELNALAKKIKNSSDEALAEQFETVLAVLYSELRFFHLHLVE